LFETRKERYEMANRRRFLRVWFFILVMFVSWNLFTVINYPVKFEVSNFQVAVYRDYNRRIEADQERQWCYVNLWAFSVLVIAHPTSP
jgi:hypothetical protein